MTKVLKIVNIADKLEKVDNSFNVYRYDNGYMLEVNGRTRDGEWTTSKIIANSIEDLLVLVKEAVTLPLD